MWTRVPLIARTPRKKAPDSIQKVLFVSAALASIPGSAAALALPARPEAGTHGGSRTNSTTGIQARTTTAIPNPT